MAIIITATAVNDQRRAIWKLRVFCSGGNYKNTMNNGCLL